MQETSTKAEELANAIFRGAHLDLQAKAGESAEGCLIAIDGADNGLLLNQGGELLDALQQILNQAFGRDLPRGQRIVCDADNYRAAREGELKAMAQHAARQVRETSSAFVFGPMDANERRVIHLTLAEEADLHTESVGDGHARRLKVSPKLSPGN
jgi:spoIIIJ-associated protein